MEGQRDCRVVSFGVDNTDSLEPCHRVGRDDEGGVDYESAVTLGGGARAWAMLAEKLVFGLEVSGLGGMDPGLVEDYKRACSDEVEKYKSWGRAGA